METLTDKERENILKFFADRDYRHPVFYGLDRRIAEIVTFLDRHHIETKYIITDPETASRHHLGFVSVHSDEQLGTLPPCEVVFAGSGGNDTEEVLKGLYPYLSCPIYTLKELLEADPVVRTGARNYQFFRDLDRRDYERELCSWYKWKTGRDLDLVHPRTYGEKIQWLKLHDTTELKTALSDKYMVREWIAQILGERYLIPMLAFCDRPEEIDWEALPRQFVIKCSHGCDFNIIVEDKDRLDKKEACRKLSNWLSVNYAFRFGLELQYRDIVPRIIIEQKMENEGGDLNDYKFLCFNGTVKVIQKCVGRSKNETENAFFTPEWEKLSFTNKNRLIEGVVPRPENLKEMVNLAEKLARGFKYVRVDLYSLDDGRIYFGEMTFTPDSGVGYWSDPRVETMFGEMLDLGL